MNIFKRKHVIEFDLHPHTMEEVIIFPSENEAGPEEYFVKKVFNPNHLQIDSRRRDSYTGGIHDLIFEPNTKRILIHSRFETSAFFLYSSSFLPLIPIFFSKDGSPKEAPTLVLVSFGLVVICTVLLAIFIRSESKDVEREMILRINYLNRKRAGIQK